MPESMIAMPIPLPVGSASVSPSCERRSLAFLAAFTSSVGLRKSCAASGAEATGASVDTDSMPGSASSQARSLGESFNEIALDRHACRPTRMPLLRNVFNSEAQSAVPSGRTMTLTVPVVPADRSTCSICRSIRAFLFDVAPPLTANMTGACNVTSAATTAQVRTLARLMTGNR